MADTGAKTSNSLSMPTEARTPTHEWHHQQLASRHNSYKADESQGYNTAQLSLLGHEEDLNSLAHEYEPIASQDQYRHHGSTSNLETSEAGFDPATPEQAPSSIVSPIETGPDAFTQKVHDLGVLFPDQICTCVPCLAENNLTISFCKKWSDEHPELRSSTFGCRVAGCQWTTKSASAFGTLFIPSAHEIKKSHYGKPGSWRCVEANCKFITKRFGDLKRHCSSKHCIKPKKLKCPVLSCRYHQDGFARKDKLDSHYQKAHGGKSQPGKPNQAIKPKIGERA